MRNLRKVSPSESDWPWTTGELALGRSQGSSLVDPVHELLALPAELVLELPEPVTLWLELEGAPARVLLSTMNRQERGGGAGDARPQTVLADQIVFDREEFRAIVIAAQADRIWRKDLLGLCFDKWRRPEHRVTLKETLAGANADAHDWTLARVLSRLGAAVHALEIGETTPESGALSVAA